jgi:cobalamin-dependent methionine synthase I
LADIGDRWFRGEATVQQEHFTSALTVQRLEMLIAASALPTRPEKIVVATSPGDFHTFSPLLLTYLLRRKGWEVIYLGADVPVAELAQTVSQIKPQLLIFSAQQLHTAVALTDMTRILNNSDIVMAFGGLIFNQVAELRRYIPGYFLGENIVAAVEVVAQLMNKQPLVSVSKTASPAYQRALKQFINNRSRIEAAVRDKLMAAGQPVEQLEAISQDFTRQIIAALRLGDITLLQTEMTWVYYLLISYRQPNAFVNEFVLAFFEAAQSYLDDSAAVVVNWFSSLTADL